MRNLPKLHPLRRAWDAWHEGQADQAFGHYQRALDSMPEDAESLQALGYLAIEMEDNFNALFTLGQAVQLDPDSPQSQLLHGVALRRKGDLAAAATAFENAACLKPGWIDAINNLAVTLEELDRHTEARYWLQHGLKDAPDDSDLLNQLGSVLCATGHPSEAAQAFHKALGREPDFIPAQFNLAQALMQSGDYESGWRLFDSRLELQEGITPPQTQATIWKGEPLKERSILVWHEQGFGDTLQFVRYLTLLVAREAKVVLRVPRELHRLLTASLREVEVISETAPLPRTDFHTPLLSLPQYFWSETQFTSDVPYLAPLHCSEVRLPPRGKRLRIGLVWAGNPRHPNDARRTLPWETLAPLLNQQDYEWVLLQIGLDADTQGNHAFLRPSRLPGDFLDSASLLHEVDLLLTVDTAFAHLAGAMGCPVWMMIPFSADWRWQTGTAETPWYPSMRLFRQPHSGDWPAVLESVSHALAEYSYRHNNLIAA